MKLGMQIDYSGGFKDSAKRVADYEKAGLDINRSFFILTSLFPLEKSPSAIIRRYFSIRKLISLVFVVRLEISV